MKTDFQSTHKFFTEVKFLRVLLLGALFMMITSKGWGQTLTATISEDATVCLNSASPEITFTGQNGTPPFYFYYNINNDVNSLVAYSETTNIATITSPTDEAGIFIYTLTSVTDLNGSAKVTGQVATITVNAFPGAAETITGTSGVCQGATGVSYSVPVISGADSYVWVYSGTGATINGTTNSVTIDFASSATSGNLTVYGSNTCGDGAVSSDYAITVNALPGAAGTITGTATFTPGTTGVAYSVPPIDYASNYIWSYTGTGVSINGSGTNVTLDFSLSATGGLLKVNGVNACGEGVEASLEILPDSKILNLTSIMLQGLYIGSGTMRQVRNETDPQWEAGVADNITIELHNESDYSVIVLTVNSLPLGTDGTANVNIPVELNGSYYITIRHRSSIETTTATSISFAGSTVSQSFGARDFVYGGNLGMSSDGHYLIHGGDVNQDNIIDSGDSALVDSKSAKASTGYMPEDINGDGLVDLSDALIVDNNSSGSIRAILP